MQSPVCRTEVISAWNSVSAQYLFKLKLAFAKESVLTAGSHGMLKTQSSDFYEFKHCYVLN